MKRQIRPAFLARMLRDEDGATALEYAFILALVTLVSVAAMTNLAGRVISMWNGIATKVVGG